MNKFIFCVILLFSITIHAQKHEHIKDSVVTKYVTIEEYRNNYTNYLSREDSLSFKFKDNDTLVKLDQYIPKGVFVPYEFKDSIFLKYYKKLAFNHKNGNYSEDTKSRYWKDEIKIYFANNVSRDVRKEIMNFTKVISSNIDSLKISEVNKLEKSNYVIYYNSDYAYESRLQYKKKSEYYIYWNKYSQLYKCSLKLDDEKYFSDKLRVEKIKTLFFQSLGYFNFVDEFDCTNYISSCDTGNKQLTELDLEFLRYHYSYGICKGTSLSIFEEQQRKAKKILKEQNRYMYFVHLN